MTIDALRELAVAQEVLLAREAKGSLRAFVQQAWPILEPTQPFVPNWHIDLLAECLEAVTAGEITRLVINIPPRYMKSLLVSVLWPTWEWAREPGRRWLFVSYAESLAIKHSRDRRAVLQSAWYQRHWGRTVRLRPDHTAAQEFQNTQRGLMVATSIGGSVTGKGGTRIVIDDPHNPTQAESDVQREHAVRFFTQTLSTRLDDQRRGAIVVVMQRLHERDLSARCLDLGFTHVCLPAEADAATTIRFPRSGRSVFRAAGSPLWPAREGPAELKERRRVLGSAAYAGQYQQRPAPAEGLILRPGWWQWYRVLPPDLELIQSWDLAFKDHATSDYVVGLLAGRVGANVYLIDRVKGRWDFTETCHQLVRWQSRYPQTSATLIEDAANGPAVLAALQSRVPRMIRVTPAGGKEARAHAVSPMIEAGNVWLPTPYCEDAQRSQERWVDDFVHACTVFPRGAHDDDVDALTQLLHRCQVPRAEPRLRRL